MATAPRKIFRIIPKDGALMRPTDYASWRFLSQLADLSGDPIPQCWIVTVYDSISPDDITRGFEQVSAPLDELSVPMRLLRRVYSDKLSSVARRSTRYCKAFFVIHSHMGDDALLHTLNQSGVEAVKMGRDFMSTFPIPFQSAVADWDTATDDTGRLWKVLETRETQYGAVTPRAVADVMNWDFPAWLVLHITGYSHRDTLKKLEHKRVATDLGAAEAKNSAQAVEAQKVGSSVGQAYLQAREYSALLHHINLFAVYSGQTRQELKDRTQVVKASLSTFAFRTAPAVRFGELFEFKPLAHRGPPLMSIQGGALVATALSNYTRTNVEGILVGTDPKGGPVILNLFDDRQHNAAHTVVLGQTGTGKTFGILTIGMRHALMGYSFVVTDVQGNINLDWLVEDCHTARLGTPDAAINPLDIVQSELETQVVHAKNLLRMLGVTSADPRWQVIQSKALSDSLSEIYERPFSKYGKGPYPANEMPLITHIEARIKAERDTLDVSTPSGHRVAQALDDLLDRISLYTRYEFAPFFGAHTSVDFNVLSRTATVYDISRLPSRHSENNLRTIFLYMLTELLSINVMDARNHHKNYRPLLAFYDEMGVLMRDKVLADSVSAAYKTNRSRGIGMLIADQSPSSLLESADLHGMNHGAMMLSEAPTRLILGLKESERALVDKYFPDIPANIRAQIYKLRRGQAVLQTQHDVTIVRILPSDFEKMAYSSRLQDRERMRQHAERTRHFIMEGA